MKRIVCLFLAGWFALGCFRAAAQPERNYLAGRYSPEDVRKLLIMDSAWVPYPGYAAREAWAKFPQEVRDEYIRRGEQYLGYGWPDILATQYLEFTRSGNRQVMERPYNERRAALQSLVMAELMEGRGRFLDDLVNGVFSFCEQTYWGYSAHFYMYTEDRSPAQGDPLTLLPDAENPIIDLGVGEVAADLAWIRYFFGEAFDRISPVINRRIDCELRQKVLEPFYRRMDYWWITGWKKGNVNNWNPWCNFNVLNAILLLEQDPEVKARAVYKTMVSVDLFYNAYPDDGACDEGPSYWSAAGAKAFDYLNLLYTASGGRINIFDKPLIRDIGSYIYRVYIARGAYFTNFADAPARINQRGGNIYRYGERTGDETMKRFGAFFLHRNRFDRQAPGGPLAGVLEDLFHLDGWQQTEPLEPLIGEYYFPDMQIAVARDRAGSNRGFYFAAKGGHNGEGHNHNDVGSGIVFYDAYPVFVDVGVGTYTAKTFSPERYQIWTMPSYYHNVPLINGQQQAPGRSYAASGSGFRATRSEVAFQTDLSGAYPAEAAVEKWVREYRLIRGRKLILTDDFRLSRVTGDTELHLMTPLEAKPVQPGVLELSGEKVKLRLLYRPSQYAVSVERKEMDDPKLQQVWGDHLNLIRLKSAGKSAGRYTLELVPAP